MIKQREAKNDSKEVKRREREVKIMKEESDEKKCGK